MFKEQGFVPASGEKRENKRERIAKLGNELHDIWRQPRWREESQDYEPRVKETKDEVWIQENQGLREVDIANTSYGELPFDWQAENKASAEVAVSEVERALQNGQVLDEVFVETASAVLHDQWLARNGEWAPPEQKVPYQVLSEEEKEKDRVIIRQAITVCSE